VHFNPSSCVRVTGVKTKIFVNFSSYIALKKLLQRFLDWKGQRCLQECGEGTQNRFAKSPISQSLTWTHFLNLMPIESEEERAFYEIK
jgi:hypothetical protein